MLQFLVRAIVLVCAAAGPVACVSYLDADAGSPIASGDGGPLDASALDGPAGSDASADGPCVGYACAVLADRPSLYLRLDESAGATTARDLSGNGLDGTYPFVGAKLGVAGATPGGTAVHFDGVQGQALRMPSGVDFAGNVSAAFSVELWIKADAVGGLRFVIDHETHSTTRGGWAVLLADGDIQLELHAQTQASTIAVVNSASKPIKVGEWHHVVFAYNGATNRPVLWVDKVVAFSGTTAGGDVLPAVGEWSIGKQNCDPCAGSEYAGAMDEVAVYDHLLNQASVDAHYAASGR